jgi:hypothetical protein
MSNDWSEAKGVAEETLLSWNLRREYGLCLLC